MGIFHGLKTRLPVSLGFGDAPMRIFKVPAGHRLLCVGLTPQKPKQTYQMNPAEKTKPMFRVRIYSR